jgi:hypothetical protein
VHNDINRVDEWELVSEVLIDQLSEFEIKAAREQFGHIREAIASMGLGECDRIENLREHGVTA